MSLVIFAILSAPGKCDLLFFAPTVQMPINKLFPIITINTQQLKRQPNLNKLESFLRVVFTATQKGNALIPIDIKVNEIKGIGKFSFDRYAAMGNQINF